MRLDKYLAETAQCTRSEAKALLSKGRVQVNGAVCKKGDTQLRETDTVAVDGKALNYQQFVYLMLNKPEGVVSASTDKRDTTVVDLVGDAYPRRQLKLQSSVTVVFYIYSYCINSFVVYVGVCL